MLREKSLSEISDGKLYKAEDSVRIGCNGCKDCSECCHSVGDSIVLDPFDVKNLMDATGLSVPELLKNHMDLGMTDRLLLPHLRVTDYDHGCTFLDANERCSVHTARPGFCRMFPLGRLYTGRGAFSYILQKEECPYPVKTMAGIADWIGYPDLPRWESFAVAWHDFLMDIRAALGEEPEEENLRTLSLFLLKTFYLTPYSGEFFDEFRARLLQARQVLHV